MGAVRKGLDGLTQGWLWIGMILTPILAHAGGLGFQAFAFFLGCGALLVVAANLKDAVYLKGLWLPFFLAFTLWAWLAALWSPHEDLRLLDNGLKLFLFALALILMPIVFLRLTGRGRENLGHVFMAGTVLAAGLFLFDVLSGYALSTFVDPVEVSSNIYVRQGEAERSLGRGLMTYTHLVWPAAILMIVSFKRGWALALTVLAAFAAAAIFNRLSLIIPTLAATAVFVALAWYRPRLGIMIAFAFAIASLVLAPLVGIFAGMLDEAALSKLPLSWEHRVRMWAYVWERIQENWLLGNGFDVSRTYQETFKARDGRDIVIVSLHPHNIGLQLWLEAGLVGVCLAAGFLIAAIKPILNFCASPARAAAMSGLVIAATLNGALTIGIWQYWWWGIIALGMCMVGLIPHEQDRKIPRR
ncbi:O-antigen ligase family protein [Litorimonas sp. WD9-15]|uniref:O-antigen ligase family protein n=1 Tax=Litorimonas sp. WD9-15 TaxID=3418716 RepID=UPI003D062DC3